jgi:sialate O-acetylesterase
LTLRLGDVVLEARANAGGNFSFDLPAMPPGGPHTLLVEGSSRVELSDVWFGEVWLASGQSNMEWPVSASHAAPEEVAAARWPAIRAFKVEPRPSLHEEVECEGRWQVCSPETVGDFSAVAYFFARELHQARGVPVGIIDATWGGTCIEAWTSPVALGPVLPALEQIRARLTTELTQLPELRAEYERVVLDWQAVSLPSDTQNRGLELGWAGAELDDSGWKSIDLPAFWQAHGMNFNGVVWFRKAVELPSAWAGHALTLSLGALDDFDHAYFDAEEVGRTPPGTLDAHRVRRRYPVPKGRVSGGRHVIAVRVFDHFGGGGFAGPAGEMFLECVALGERIALAGPWRVGVEREIPLLPMSVFESLPRPPLALALQHAPGALFNAMLAPLIPYALRGAIWYQGESNVDRHQEYHTLMLALIRDLRTRWGQGQFPFYYVQLASFAASPTWPRLREAQSAASSEPETGMVVTLDVGESSNIHPSNKQEVGRRLALWARARTYGEAELVHEGPRLLNVAIDGSVVRVRFTNAGGLRTADGGEPRGFSLAGLDGRHVPARASIDESDVLLSCPEVARPCAVRYAFSDDPDVNLQNGAGLPAAPFRTDLT